MKRGIIVLPAVMMLASPLLAGPATPDVHQAFMPGLYRVSPIDPDSRATEKPRLICAMNADAITHLNHNDVAGCQNQLVQSGDKRTVVNYSCHGAGWGRSELRRETPALYQLDTQGIKGREPFAMRAEIRRIGDCHGAMQAAAHR